jgi:hypothetical protein
MYYLFYLNYYYHLNLEKLSIANSSLLIFLYFIIYFINFIFYFLGFKDIINNSFIKILFYLK